MNGNGKRFDAWAQVFRRRPAEADGNRQRIYKCATTSKRRFWQSLSPAAQDESSSMVHHRLISDANSWNSLLRSTRVCRRIAQLIAVRGVAGARSRRRTFRCADYPRFSASCCSLVAFTRKARGVLATKRYARCASMSSLLTRVFLPAECASNCCGGSPEQRPIKLRLRIHPAQRNSRMCRLEITASRCQEKGSKPRIPGIFGSRVVEFS